MAALKLNVFLTFLVLFAFMEETNLATAYEGVLGDFDLGDLVLK